MTAAERLFLEKGVENTSIEDMTSGAAVSKGSFYLHFTSKADVVEALRNDFVENLVSFITAKVEREHEGDWSARLTTWVTACAEGYLNATRLHHLLFSAAPAPARKGLTQNILIDDLRDLLEAGCRDHAWSLEDPAFTAVFLFNALHAVVDQGEKGRSAEERDALLRNIRLHTQRIISASAIETIKAGAGDQRSP
ncbi:TetR/AcrR family transcriptional regulator [Rhizobium sp. Leaf371]|uniref:TetR/AcrR family transcriptional regulator n=1 Tax=Rhizobium sp. Leaf371 TaxID=1736355 RepID=UPI0012E7E5CA|nr:TetR/AcrR family transcriptional regulator [Rhizobium sp. Leaf371]